MAGFGATEPAGGPWAVDLGEDAVPILGDGYDYVGTDRLGAWLFEVFLDRLYDDSATRGLPPLLGGDALSIFQDRATGGAARRGVAPAAVDQLVVVPDRSVADLPPGGAAGNVER